MIKLCLALLLTLTATVLFPSLVLAQNIDPQYIFIRKSPMHCVPDCSYNWNFNTPNQINTATMMDVINLVGTRGSDQRKLGIGVEINYLSGHNMNNLKQSLTNLLSVSEQNNVPVFINLSGYQWWGNVRDGNPWNGTIRQIWDGRPDLWNWWDSTKTGYNPENINNVEWTCWEPSCAIKKAWRDWGSPGDFEVRPPPNLASQTYINETIKQLEKLVPIIAKWYAALPVDKKWLLGGVSNGTEIDIGGNYHVYSVGDSLNDLSQSLQTGYAAVKTAGIRNSGDPPTGEELNEVIRRYLNELDKFVYDQGIPRSKIYNHTGGFDIYANSLPLKPVFPTTAGALTQYGAPGWSFYGSVTFNPQNYSGLTATLNQINNSEWASPEWNPMILNDGNQYQNWIYSLQNTLSFRNNRFINISNWEDNVRGQQNVLDAIKTVVNESPSCWVTAPQMKTITSSGGNVTLTWQRGNYDHAYLLISTIGDFGIDGILTNKNVVQDVVTNLTTYTKNSLAPGKYYWEFEADGCVDSQYHFQNKISDGSFVVAKPGDLDGDNDVDIFDYNLLVTNFGNPYTIFDYNVLVGNFGK